MTRKEVDRYIKNPARFIKGEYRNGHFEPVAMLSKEEDQDKRTALAKALKAMKSMYNANVQRHRNKILTR